MILLLDNYDSFVYNLSRYLRELGCATEVVRNDAVSVADIERMDPQAIVISPGPCTPAQAGSRSSWCDRFPPRFQSWEFVSVIRRSPKPSEEKWSVPRFLYTE
jgi:anthranilate/para-aminobenzoate synthase component II